MKRLDSALIAGVGILVVHQVGYATSAAIGFEADIGHGHHDLASARTGILASHINRCHLDVPSFLHGVSARPSDSVSQPRVT